MPVVVWKMMTCTMIFNFILVLLLFLQTGSMFIDATKFNSGGGSTCIAKERKALLKFKKGLKDPSGWLSSWIGEDCCNWYGVGCSNLTGNVVKINLKSSGICHLFVNVSEAPSGNLPCLGGTLNPSLLNLTNLNYLDLSYNNFQGIPIPSFIGSLKNLRYLDLSEASFSGMVPPQLGNLSNLVHLDLTTYSYPNELWISDMNWISGVPSLQYLALGGLNLSQATKSWLQAANMLPALLELHLPSCELIDLPQSLPIVNFTSLQLLDLSSNYFNSSIPQWASNISTLVTVNLRVSQLRGSITEVSWQKLCNLQYIDLSFNAITGEIKEPINALSVCSNNSLWTLDLSYNKLSGELPDSLVFFNSLQTLQLSQNSFSGPIPLCIVNMSSLSQLDLSFNTMGGIIPESIRQLTSLNQLNLYGNLWEGTITEFHLQNLTGLIYFAISSSTANSLVLNIRHDWVPPFNLFDMAIGDCQVGPSFPVWLRTQTLLSSISLSNAAISGIIPDWLWILSPTIWWLDLSGNQLRGTLPISISVISDASVDLSFNCLEGSIPLWPNVTSLSLSNNSLSGPIPWNIGQVMSNLQYLDLSRNLLNGSIPTTLSMIRNLSFLDLSSNYISGDIPLNWQDLQWLTEMDLSNNNLSGSIPSSLCSLPSLFWLRLSSNNLYGELSSSLQNCTGLFSLDLGYNRFSGTLSGWIADNLHPFSYLSLRANMLTGNIPEVICRFPGLHILDLAQNNLSGSIPKCFGNLTALKTQTTLIELLPSTWPLLFFEHTELNLKGTINEYTKIIPLVKSIDLSSNNLSGEIPTEITDLSFLGTLNLSSNQLTGQIPDNIGSLKLLETLDLSLNHLSGAIPPGMSSMTLLSHLNLSYNNLSGQIPSGNQFQTFNDPSIFEGNPGLCGPPLPTTCLMPGSTSDGSNSFENGNGDDDAHDMWFYVSMGLGFIVGFWAVCGSLVINKSWRNAYFNFIDEVKDRLCLINARNVSRKRRKINRGRQDGRN